MKTKELLFILACIGAAILIGLATTPLWGAQYLKQSTADTIIIGPFKDATDGVTRETALTVTGWECQIFKNDANSVLTITASGGDNDAVHSGMGEYTLELTAGNTDTLGILRVDVNDSNTTGAWETFHVVTANWYDSMFSTDKLKVDVNQFDGDAAEGYLDKTDNQIKADVIDFNDNSLPCDGNEVISNLAEVGSGGASLTDVPWNSAWDAEIESEVDDALGGSGTGTALTAVPWNSNWDAEVESEVDDALGGGTGTALTAMPWNSAWNAEVQSESDDALSAFAWKTTLYGEDANGLTEDDSISTSVSEADRSAIADTIMDYDVPADPNATDFAYFVRLLENLWY